MRRRLSLKSLLALGLSIMTSNMALSLPEDRDKPIQLEADRAQLDQRTGTSVYEGNVVITQGSMRLAADTVTIYTEEGNFQRMEAIGQPVNLYYTPATNKEEIHGTSQRVEYDATKNLIVMTINAKIIQGTDIFTGDRIEYDLNADLVRAKGDKSKRIQIIIQPKSKK